MSRSLSDFQPDYLLRLPLPLAQLYRRSHNAAELRARHNNTFFLFEATIKLAASALVACYVRDLQAGEQRAVEAEELLANLKRPALGHWIAILRELSRHYGRRPDAASHFVGHLARQLEEQRRDRLGLLALYRRIKNGPDGVASNDQSCCLLEVFDAIVRYRNTVIGHGADRFDTFYSQDMGPLLFPAANDLLSEGVLDVLGPVGSRLVYLGEVRRLSADSYEVGVQDLSGVGSVRAAPLMLNEQQAAHVLPNRIAILWPGQSVPLVLHPLLVFRESQLSEDVRFLNADRRGKQVEYLSYTSGATECDPSTVSDLAQVLELISKLTIERLDVDSQHTSTATERDFEIISEIGSGGMGVVYLARQVSLGRLVALKTLPAEQSGDAVSLARFDREIRALGQCDDPHIVKVLTSGKLPNGQRYYAMEFVPGADLEVIWRELAGPNRRGEAGTLGGSTWTRAVLTACRKQRSELTNRSSQRTAHSGSTDLTRHDPTAPIESQAEPRINSDQDSKLAELISHLPPVPELPDVEQDPGGYARRIAVIVRDAARALQTVHDHNIVHRDVKPANLMLTPDGSRVVLMDFGLAKGATRTLEASRAAGLLGTLRYAAPEQLAAANIKVGPAADVRGLGVTFWELLTRQRLFGEAEDEQQLTSWVLNRPVPPIRAIDATLDKDLEAIVAVATERNPEDRLRSARELADLLDLYLGDKPLPIRMPGPAELLRRWARENRKLVNIAAAAALAILLTITASFFLVLRAKNVATGLAKANAALAKKEKSARLDADQQKNKALQLARSNQKLAIDEQSARKDADQKRIETERHLRVATAQRLAAQSRVTRDQFPIRSLLLSIEAVRTTLAASEPLVPAAHQSLRDALAWTGGRPLIGHTESIDALAFSADNRWLITGSADETARLWDLAAGSDNEPLTGKVMKFVEAPPLPDDAPTLFFGQKTGVICLAASPDGHWIAAGSADRTVRIWDLTATDPADAPTYLLPNFADVRELAFSRDNRWLVSVCRGQPGVRVWDMSLPDPATGPPRLLPHSDSVWEMAFSDDGHWLASASDGQLRLWDFSNAEPAETPREFLGDLGVVSALRFSTDSRWLLVNGVLFDIASSDALEPLVQLDKDARYAAFSPDTRWAITSGGERLRLWDMQASTPGASIIELRGHEQSIYDLTMDPLGRWLVTAGGDRTVRLWNLKAKDPGSSPIVLHGHEDTVYRVAISSDGRWLATGSADRMARLWDLGSIESGASPRSFQLAGADFSEYSPNVSAVIVADNGPSLTASGGGVVVHWDLSTFRSPPSIEPENESFFSRTPEEVPGRRTVKLGEYPRYRVTKELLSLNGQWLAVIDFDYSLYLWDLSTSSQPTLFTTDLPAVLTMPKSASSVAISDDGRLLATAYLSDPVRIWDLSALRQGERAPQLELPTNDEITSALAFSHDGTRLATAGHDKIARVWDIGAGATNPSIVLAGHDDVIYDVQFSKDDTWLATGGGDSTVRLWDLKSANPTTSVMILAGHEKHANEMAFSPDRHWLAAASGDETIRLWDLSSAPPTEPVILSGHRRLIASITVSGDGNWLASGSDTLRLWELEIDALLKIAERTAGRTLTAAEREKYQLKAGATENGDLE